MPVAALQNVSVNFLDITVVPGGGGSGSVTSVDVSGGTTGLTSSGGPIVGAGTITLSGILGVANGGTGTGALVAAGYVKSTGAAFTNQTVPIPIADGGTNTTVAPPDLSVIFSNAGAYATDPKLEWDTSTGRFGVGTVSRSLTMNVGAAPGQDGINVTNSDAGSASSARVVVRNDIGAVGSLDVYSSGFVGTGIARANTTVLQANLANTDLSLGTAGSGKLNFYTGGGAAANLRGTIASGGNWQFFSPLATLYQSVNLNAGLNSDIALPASSYVRITGPGGAFSIGGFTNPVDGRKLLLYNSTSQTMTIVNEDAGTGNTADRIKTLTGGNITLSAASPAIVEFIYDATDQRWILVDAGINAGFIKQDGTVPLTAAWTAGNFNIDSKNSQRVFNVVAYGADATGVADSKTAINNAITDAAVLGGVVYFPPGTFRVVQTGATVPFIINQGQVQIQGSGKGVTNISFEPASGGAVFQFNTSGAQINYNAIRDISFRSPDAAIQKTMVLAQDLNDFVVERISNTPGTSWTGTSSIGVQFRGRQLLRMKNCQIVADLPVKISDNPNTAGANEISFDHSTIEQCDLQVTAGLNNQQITIDDGCVISNCRFSDLSLTRGNGGIFFNNTTQVTASYDIKCSNIRVEQSNTTTGYAIQFTASTGGFNTLSIDGLYVDGVAFPINCINLSSAVRPVITSTLYGGAGTFLNLAASVSGLTIINSSCAAGSTITDLSVNPTTINFIKGATGPSTNIGQITSVANGLFSARSLALKSRANLSLPNGRNDNVVVGDVSLVPVAGSGGGAFQISGIVPTGGDGQILLLYYNGGQVFTLNNNDVNSAAANRLFLPGGANKIVNATNGTALLVYVAGYPGWVMLSFE
jgi:hypothetical protein